MGRRETMQYQDLRWACATYYPSSDSQTLSTRLFLTHEEAEHYCEKIRCKVDRTDATPVRVRVTVEEVAG